jgi:hypothetical protein
MPTITAYQYLGGTHCVDCTVRTSKLKPEHGGFGTLPEWHPSRGDGEDENGIRMDAMTYESDPVHPLYSWEEWINLDPSYLAEYPVQWLACEDCREVIDEYDSNGNGG